MSSTPTRLSSARPLVDVRVLCALWLSAGLILLLTLSFLTAEVVRAQGSPGALSFSQSAFSVNEDGGSAAITLRRTGGTDGEVTAKVTFSDGTTSSADYLFAPGTLDPTFASQPFSGSFFYSKQIALQSDGKVLIGVGGFARLNANGTPDSSFSHGAMNGGVTSIAIQSDGKIIVAGGFTTIGGITRNGVARLNSDGSLDGTFDVGVGSNDVNILAIQDDGKVLVGGVFSNFNLAPGTDYVARLNTDGSVDSSFQKGGNVSTTYALVVQPDGKILMGGLGSVPVMRLHQDGSVDSAFNCDLAAPVLDLALQSDGRILAGGHFESAGGQAIPPYIARLNPDGSRDTGFNIGQGPDRGVVAIALQPDGKVIIGGDFNLFNGAPRANIARLNPNGSLDNTFNSSIPTTLGAGNYIHALLLQPDGKMIGAGFFTATGPGFNRPYLARFSGDLFATWKNGDDADKLVNLSIRDDLEDETDETLALTLIPLTGGATAGTPVTATLTIVDNDVPPAITSALPPNGITRLSYSHTFTATGTPNPTFSVTAGSLPPGLFLQTSGVLSGTPTTAGTFSNITVTAANGVVPSATQTFSITILSGGTLQFSSPGYILAEGGGSITITVTRTGGSAGPASVNFGTSSGSATIGVDFIPTQGTLSFADGETSKTFDVSIISDSLDELDESLNLSLSNAPGSGAVGSPSLATLVIIDDDPTPTITIADAVLTEGNAGTKQAIFTLTLSAPSGANVTVGFSTASGTATGSDYQVASGAVFFQPGVTVRTVAIFVFGDTAAEPDETFFLNLANPVQATIARAQATATIINDDNGGGNPIDLNGFFVRQHYVDFFSREPDTAGLAFWTNQIAECQQPGATCSADVRRINVSAAFFLSIEFQETGYLVERIYKSAYGDATGTSNFGPTHQLSVPVIRFNEFLPDTQLIGQDVVVGEGDWQAKIEANKVAFTQNFVTRVRFILASPTTLTPAQFVDALYSNTGVTPAAAERTSVVGEFGGAGNTTDTAARARALRRVAENATLVIQEKNKAFVLMQYYGYLRRNPNQAPDADYSGYDFWLTKLNQFNGNFVAAEMVKAFLVSSEYRQRFGP